MCAVQVVKQNYYPFNYVLPTGDMFNFCGRNGRIIQPETGEHSSHTTSDASWLGSCCVPCVAGLQPGRPIAVLLSPTAVDLGR